MATGRLPIVVVLGATGAGKSKLAVEIAKIFCGEIISADSMQIYKGLDIITNKVTEEEKMGCPHHLMSYLDVDTKYYNVVEFRDAALPVLSDIMSRKKLPIIVGGTNYYIESLLWDFLIDKRMTVNKAKEKVASSRHDHLKSDLTVWSSFVKSSAYCSSSPSPGLLQASSFDTISHGSDGLGDKSFASGTPCRISSVSASTPCAHGSQPHLNSTASLRTNPSDMDSNNDIIVSRCQREISKTADYTNTDLDIVLRLCPNTADNTNITTSRACPEALDSNASTGQLQNLPNIGFNNDLQQREHSRPDSPGDVPGSSDKGLDEMLNELLAKSSAELYAELERVDPEVAKLHHPNNKRKIVRALQVYLQTGQPMSSILREQHQGQDHLKSGPLRCPNPCILWIKCDSAVLDQRLDSRVDDMLERGLISELDTFYHKIQTMESQHASSSPDDNFDYTHGVLQMIGFKEFGSYLKLTPEQRASEEGRKEFEQGVSQLKLATRKYARKQLKWIQNRFCARPGSNVPPVYAVDSTDLKQWNQTVQEALDVVTAFMQGKTPEKEPVSITRKLNAVPARNVCNVCAGQIFIRLDEWQEHLKTKKHKHNLKSITKQRQKLCDTLEARAAQLASTQQTAVPESQADKTEGE
ncbi:tRNA dimethylallyltransferase-like [Biomphalaria glabrata]|uniref:tRNA dimethylallyltransferase-like n=1 Tax=Biomphalaria glabrata TaxID=6526 RepID=A0A9W3AFR2_BIOGL|nr:tRNA dimethylallyltransferase-like [Biomphalaria glabrata]